jgi:hypothetical protein
LGGVKCDLDPDFDFLDIGESASSSAEGTAACAMGIVAPIRHFSTNCEQEASSKLAIIQ